jgi:hypothetical protein
MKREDAIALKEHGVRAIEELSVLLNIAFERCSPEEREQIKRGVGLSIGRIYGDLLAIIYKQYPEIDHLLDGPAETERTS